MQCFVFRCKFICKQNIANFVFTEIWFVHFYGSADNADGALPTVIKLSHFVLFKWSQLGYYGAFADFLGALCFRSLGNSALKTSLSKTCQQKNSTSTCLWNQCGVKMKLLGLLPKQYNMGC